MKLYTIDYSFNKPTQQTITVGTNTDYMIGVSAVKNGELLGLRPQDVTLTIGENVLTSEKLINGYVVFDYSQGRTPASEIVKVTILGTAFELLIVGKFSSKGDVDVSGSGGYSAGEGIKIESGEISIDEEVVAVKSDLVDYSGGNGISIDEGEISIDEEVVAVKSDLNGVLKEGDVYSNDEIDDKINQFAAHYITKRTGSAGAYSYPQFATHADLAAAKAAHTAENPQFFYGDEGHTPDKNDYCVVLADETHDGKTTRYAFVGDWDDNGYFRYQYTINETTLDQDQWNAIDSGITSDKLEALETAVTTIPTMVSQLENDAGYVTTSELPPIPQTTALFEGEYEDGESFSMNVYIA